MLYIINNTASISGRLDSLKDISPTKSPILFFEDGVYAVMEGSRNAEYVKELLETHPIYVLIEDVQARGIKRIIPGIESIGYDGFVELVENHDVVPWLRN